MHTEKLLQSLKYKHNVWEFGMNINDLILMFKVITRSGILDQ